MPNLKTRSSSHLTIMRFLIGFMGVLATGFIFFVFAPSFHEAMMRPYKERDAKIAKQIEQKEGILICVDQRPPGLIEMQYDFGKRGTDSINLAETSYGWCKTFAKNELVPFSPAIFMGGSDGMKLWIAPMKDPSKRIAEFTFSHNMTTEALIFDRSNEVKVVDLDEL